MTCDEANLDNDENFCDYTRNYEYGIEKQDRTEKVKCCDIWLEKHEICNDRVL